jgi:hypothetical protein
MLVTFGISHLASHVENARSSISVEADLGKGKGIKIY